MKKPNITEGEWEALPSVFDDGVAVNTKEGEWFDVVGKRQEENAKAISAVPDMIDALIEAYKFLQTDREIFKEKYGHEPNNLNAKITKIEQALKKAGATEL